MPSSAARLAFPGRTEATFGKRISDVLICSRCHGCVFNECAESHVLIVICRSRKLLRYMKAGDKQSMPNGSGRYKRNSRQMPLERRRDARQDRAAEAQQWKFVPK